MVVAVRCCCCCCRCSSEVREHVLECFYSSELVKNIFVQLIEKSLRLPLSLLFDDDDEKVFDRMISSCSLSSNVSLTKRLIEVGDCSSNDVHRFSNRSEWIDGLDQWSIEETFPSFSSSLHFDQGLRLYLPLEKNKEPPGKVSTKLNSIPSNESLPLRLQLLLEKAKDLSSTMDHRLDDSFLQSDSLNSSSFEQTEDKHPKRNEKKPSIRSPRHPLRSIDTDYSSSSAREGLSAHRKEEENLDKILKEHLTSLFTRGSITQRTSIQIPLINIKHDNHFTRSIPSIDSTIILQRYEKLQQLLLQPMKRISRTQQRPTTHEHQRTNFGLTITPLAMNNNQLNKNNSTNEQTDSFDQEEEEESGRLVRKENLHHSFLSSSGDFLVESESSICPSRRLFRSHRLSSRSQPTKRNNSQYLPPILTGKRLQISFNELHPH